MSKNPRVMALRFRIWQFASPRGWNVTTEEIAESLSDVTSQQVGILLHTAGWSQRVAKVKKAPPREYNSVLASGSRRAAGAVYRELVGQQLGVSADALA